ncbi:sigma-70 family RNA polymerase sigma factor, partial [Corynebacterium pyruviciproducens]|uniref:sigma-70 family RNA polymerase sigma factor n=1 Tax=Corynebacterium pyruviciproducens TaxID=598660 RepID=UPI0024551026
YRAMGRDKTTPTDTVPEFTDSGLTPEAYALVEDGSNRVREILDCLSDRAREIIILRVFVGLSAEETAEIVGSTPGAVRVAQHRALATMRRMYESEGVNAHE